MEYFLGVDIGTGSTKAVAINDTADKILSTEQVAYPTLHPSPLYSEQAPELIWQALIKCISRTASRLGSSPAAIGFSTAMHSVIAIDASGEPLTNMVTWADGRSAQVAERIRRSRAAKNIYKSTGTPIHAMCPLSKIIWFRENEPQIFEKTSRFISIKEYLWYKLFGDFQIDHSAASGTGLFDILHLKWYTPSLKLAGIRSENLSSPVPTHYYRSDLSEALRNQLRLSRETVFVIGGGDGCLANLGSNAIEPGTACLTIGTSGAIRIGSASPWYDFKRMSFNYILDNKTFICGGPINNGGGALKWFLHDFLEKPLSDAHDYADSLSEIARVSPGSEGLIFLPYLMGERAPIWNSRSNGAFFGITLQHRQKHFARAVIEGISFALYQVTQGLEEASGKLRKINASGGFVKSREWLQILCDIFDTPVHCNNREDASAIGAALLAIKASRQLTRYPIFDDKQDPEIFVPDPGRHQRYAVIFDLYKRLYEKVEDEMAALHEIHVEPDENRPG